MYPDPESSVAYPHIDLRSPDSPTIAGTTMKVVELVMAQQAHGWSPAELHFQFPHLSMSQVHAALAYYWDHQTELDADIERRKNEVERIRESSPESPIVNRLRALKTAS